MGVAESDNAGLGEDRLLEEEVDFAPKGVALEHDFEIEGVGVIEANDSGVSV